MRKPRGDYFLADVHWPGYGVFKARLPRKADRHSIVKVKCAGCGDLHETAVQTSRKAFALEHDSFFCCEECGDGGRDNV
ncbi:hypothetical protein COT48_05095 [Candidatus Woesearchaeota archaeon CG08_land_8_20_14_0_20_47_9]|nr:MAG: hypothetical protein COT48_05095 [Candidatus Woesearchaeota archaeon CG08_land_8_20_14_0_20_47_9]